MEILMLLLGFGIAVLAVPPKLTTTIQRTVRRRAAQLIQKKNTKGDL